MLRRFELVKNNGIFENFRWDANVPDFERINLIYGTNGAGKTSLARALDSLSQERGGFSEVSVRLSGVDKANERSTNQSHDPDFERVFVFSEGYVARSHNFVGDTQINAVLTLGERTVEDEKRIAKLRDLIDDGDSRLENARKVSLRASKSLDDEYTAVARGIVTALSRAGGDYRSNGSYNKGTVKNRFAASRAAWILLSNEEKDAALATVVSDERQKVEPRSYSYEVREKLIEDAAVALQLSPVSVVLDTLKDHADASGWVDTGRHHHDGLAVCIFCGGELTEARKKAIEQHFSDEVERAKKILDGLIIEVEKAQASVLSLVGDDVIAGSLFDDLRDSFRAAYRELKPQVAAMDNWLARLLVALQKKRENVVSQVVYKIPVAPVVNGSGLEDALTTHNNRVSQRKDLVFEAAKMMEHHLLKEAEQRVDDLADAAKERSSEKIALETELREYREEIAALENAEGDPLPSAEVMATELTRILGRNELSFELLPDGKHYRVTRFGIPARDLSTGERTAISLIHFLENVKASAAHQGKAVVVIDDPISSLDSGVAMGVSTYMWSEALTRSHIEQIFLLTHNFDLFRQWDIQLDGLRGERGPKNKHGFTSNCYEITAPHKTVANTTRRVPQLITWPPNEETRKKVRSSYHHAFITAVRAHQALLNNPSMEKKLDALLLFPNVLRRILETFLAFKAPATANNFTEAMRDAGEKLEALDFGGDAHGLRLQLTRFTHAYSHAESPDTVEAVNPDEIGATIAAVFMFMYAVDKEHFEGLCEVVGVEPVELIVETPPLSSSL